MKLKLKRLASVGSQPRSQSGFTLIELMVGMAVGLLVTLAISSVLFNAERQRRSTTSGSDAQINGGLAIYAMERQLKMAGYGIVTEQEVTGCLLSVKYGGSAIAGAPSVLAPVLITAGGAGVSDSVRILASTKSGFVMPMPVAQPFYDPNNVSRNTNYGVKFSMGVKSGDLLAVVYASQTPATSFACEVFEASPPGAGAPANTMPNTNIARNDGGNWNASKFPSMTVNDGDYIVNLGAFKDLTFSVSPDLKLRQTMYNLASQTSSSQDVQTNIVLLKAYYGKDSSGDDVLDTFDTTTPATNADWLKLRAVRIAVVARSAEYEKDEVTAANPVWDVGNAAPVSGSTVCGSSHCVTMKVDGLTDWKHYRYKVFDVLVPLRNQMWKSTMPVVLAPSAPASGGI